MIAQPEMERKTCSHCYGRKSCDCPLCGQKVKYIDFGGKWHEYYESKRCRVCRGEGLQPRFE